MGNVLTLRNVPPELMSIIRERSRKRRMSINKAAISLFEERLGMSRPPQAEESHHDLDHLAGRWSDEESNELDRVFREMRLVDQEQWR